MYMKIKALFGQKEKREKRTENVSQSSWSEKINLENLSKGLILLFVLILPVFFLELGGVTNLEFNKQTILLIMSVIALVFFFLEKIVKGEFEIQWSALHLFSFVFLLLVLVSTILSRWLWGSIWGWPLDASDGFLTIFCFLSFYFLFSHLIKKKEVFWGQAALIFGGALIALVSGLQLFGKFLLPWDFTKITSFNPIGTANSWSIFLGALLPIAIALILAAKKAKRVVFSAFGILMLVGLFLANYWLAWVEVLIGMFVFLVFGLWRSDGSGYRFLILPAVVFTCALLFGVFKIQIPGLPETPLEVIPSFSATLNVAINMLKESPKDLLFGWGPGTFRFGWSKFKDISLNQTIFWSVRFSKGKAEILDILGKLGILGALSYVSLIGFGIYKAVKGILYLDPKQSREQFLMFGVLCSFIALSAMKFLYLTNLSLNCVWWFLLANIAIFSAKNKKTFKLTADSRVSFAFSFLGVLILVGSVFLFYLQGTRYLAEAKYLHGLNQTDLEVAKDDFLQAIRLNPQQELFWQDLANIYLLEAREEISRVDISAEEKTEQIGNMVANAVAAAKRTTEISPFNVANWQTRGSVYREIIGLSQNSFEWSVKAYETALDLEPANPFILVELGRVYLAQAGLVTTQEELNSHLAKAEDYFRQAITLKSDYAQAYYQLSLVYEAQGKRDEAIATLETIKNTSSFVLGYDSMQDVGLAFQLGVLYYRDEQLAKAQSEFERAVAISPTYSNARYFLGLIYDETGQTNKAIEQFKIIKEFNPENEEITKVLDNIENGLPALTGVIANEEAVPLPEEPEEQ